jgi:hypothetical protein
VVRSLARDMVLSNAAAQTHALAQLWGLLHRANSCTARAARSGV